MNRTDYLLHLQKYLKKLPKADYDNAMEYFTEYFDEAGEEREQEVIRDLGTPREAASELLKNLLGQKLNSPQQLRKKLASSQALLWVTSLSILAVPAGLPIICAAIILILCILLLSILLLGAILCDIIFFAASFFLLLKGVLTIGHSLPGACIILGIALASLGLCILLSLFVGWVCQKMVMGAARLIQHLL